MADIPDDLEADKAGKHKDDEMLHEAGRGKSTHQKHQQAATKQHEHLALGLLAEGFKLCFPFLFGRQFLDFLFGLGGNGLNFRRWRREGDLAFKGDGCTTDHIVFHVMDHLAVFFRRQVGHHVTDVGGVKLRRLGRHAGGEIGVADDGHAIVGDDLLVLDRAFHVAAAFGCKVDDHRAGLHGRDHILKPELGRRAVGDQSGGDDDVHVASDLAEFGELGVAEFFGLNRSIPTGGRAVLLFFLEIEIDKLSAHGFDLLGHFWAHVEGIGYGPERDRGANGGKTGNTGTNDQDLGGRHFTGGGDLTGEETTEIVTSLDDGTVTGNVGHGRQGVHLLGAGNAGHHFHGDHIGPGLLGRFHTFFVTGRVEEGNQRLVFFELLQLARFWLANLGNDVGTRPERLGIGHNLHTGFGIGLIREARERSGSGFKDATISQLLELLGRRRRHRDTRLSLKQLFRCTYLHDRLPSLHVNYPKLPRGRFIRPYSANQGPVAKSSLWITIRLRVMTFDNLCPRNQLLSSTATNAGKYSCDSQKTGMFTPF